jgi:hypothetical protein
MGPNFSLDAVDIGRPEGQPLYRLSCSCFLVHCQLQLCLFIVTRFRERPQTDGVSLGGAEGNIEALEAGSDRRVEKAA